MNKLKKFLNKIKAILIPAVYLLPSSLTSVFAEGDLPEMGDNINKGLQVIFLIAGALGVWYIGLGGFRFCTAFSSDNPALTEKSFKTMITGFALCSLDLIVMFLVGDKFSF